MQSIITKYLPATNTKGSRIKAMASGGTSVTLSWDDALGTQENHLCAAMALVEKLNWPGTWVEGGLYDGNSIWVCVDNADEFTHCADGKSYAGCLTLAREA